MFSIVDKIVKSEAERELSKFGFVSNDEITQLVPLVNVDLSKITIPSPTTRSGTFSASEAKELLQTADSLDIKTHLVSLPYICVEEPNITYKSFKYGILDLKLERFMNEYSGQYVLCPDEEAGTSIHQNKDNLESELSIKFGSTNVTELLLQLPSDLKEHIASGRKFYLHPTRDGYLKWISRSDYMLLRDWQKHIAAYKSEIKDWHNLYAQVMHAQTIHRAVEQKHRLANLPFSWSAGIKPVLSGLSENSIGNGAMSKTVTHLIVDQDIHIGRLKRLNGQFLCSQPKKHLLECKEVHTLYSDGHAVLKVPFEITCQECLSKINSLMNISK